MSEGELESIRQLYQPRLNPQSTLNGTYTEQDDRRAAKLAVEASRAQALKEKEPAAAEQRDQVGGNDDNDAEAASI